MAIISDRPTNETTISIHLGHFSCGGRWAINICSVNEFGDSCDSMRLWDLRLLLRLLLMDTG